MFNLKLIHFLKWSQFWILNFEFWVVARSAILSFEFWVLQSALPLARARIVGMMHSQYGLCSACRLPKQESPMSSIRGWVKTLKCGLKAQCPPQPRALALGKRIKQPHAPCKGNFKKRERILELPLQGAWFITSLYPGRCPGLWRNCPFRARLWRNCPFRARAVEKLPFQAAGCVVCTFALIPKHIPLVIFNIIQFQKLPVFILKWRFLMMLPLVFDIRQSFVYNRLAYRQCRITTLPCKPWIFWRQRLNPSTAIALNILHKLRWRNITP